MEWTMVFWSIAAIWFLSFTWSLSKNYLVARKSGFPILICPINPHNPLWMIVGGMMLKSLGRHLPKSLWLRIRYTMHGWEFTDQQNPTPSPSPVFMLVTPGPNELFIEDVEVANIVMTRRKDFVQAKATKLLIGPFGPNVITSDGHDWQRQRRIVAEALNERISKQVWDESLRQAQNMLNDYIDNHNGKTDQTITGLRQIAMSVLASAGYGDSPTWNSEKRALPPGHELTYTDVLVSVATGFFLVALVPARILCLNIWPAAVRKIGIASNEFPLYTKEIVEQERASSATRYEAKKNFLSTMVKLSDDEKRQSDLKSALYLTEEEIQGNLYQFTIAGYDTTANTLAYAVTLLAIYPKWQDWVIEEIDHVLLASADSHEYEEIYPKLTRCMALLYETLRLYTPVGHVSRAVDVPQSLTTTSGTYHIAAGTQVFIDQARMHIDTQIWGSDALEFRPSRWLAQNGDASPEELVMPRGVFLPWSGGPRVCPGMKMAKVEFLSVITALFRRCTVAPTVEAGETIDASRARTLGVVRDSQPRITLQMNRPNDVKLVWKER